MSIKTRLLLAEQRHRAATFEYPPILIIHDAERQADEISEYNSRWPVIGLTISISKAEELL